MNESIVAIPPNVEEPLVLKRFLQRLVEELDQVLGFRGDDALVRQSELNSATSSVTQSAETTLAGVAEALVTVQEQVAQLTATVEDGSTGVQSQIDDIKVRLDDLEAWMVTAQAELDDHEIRITALENP